MRRDLSLSSAAKKQTSGFADEFDTHRNFGTAVDTLLSLLTVTSASLVVTNFTIAVDSFIVVTMNFHGYAPLLHNHIPLLVLTLPRPGGGQLFSIVEP